MIIKMVLLKLDVSLKSTGKEDDYIVEASLFENGQEIYTESKDVKVADNKVETLIFKRDFPEIKRWSAETSEPLFSGYKSQEKRMGKS